MVGRSVRSWVRKLCAQGQGCRQLPPEAEAPSHGAREAGCLFCVKSVGFFTQVHPFLGALLGPYIVEPEIDNIRPEKGA